MELYVKTRREWQRWLEENMDLCRESGLSIIKNHRANLVLNTMHDFRIFILCTHILKIKVAFSVTNCICHDQRVMKIAETARKLECDITIIGRRSGECCNSGSVPFKTKRFRMIFKRGFPFLWIF